jgi:hypothetical protein
LPLASALVSGCGFSLHANTSVPAHRRDQLERLLRYTARGAVSLERLKEGTDGDLLYPFNRPWSALVRCYYGHQTLAAGVAGEARRLGAPAASASSPLWGVLSAA